MSKYLPRFCAFVAVFLLTALGSIFGQTSGPQTSGSIATQPPGKPSTASPTADVIRRMRTAPYSAIRWHDDSPEVELDGLWYQLLAIDDLPAGQIVDYVKKQSGVDASDPEWKVLFDTRIITAIHEMGDAVKDTVSLHLRAVAFGQEITRASTRLTDENFDVLSNIFPKSLMGGTITFFQDVRLDGPVRQVKMGDTWYELSKIDDHTAAQIIDFSRNKYGDKWQKMIGKYSASVLRDMVPAAFPQFVPSHSTSFVLKTLDTNEPVTIVGDWSLPSSGLPFSAIRWHGNAPQIYVNDKWFDLLAINDLPYSNFIDQAGNDPFLNQFGPDHAKYQFVMNLNRVLNSPGTPVGPVQLKLQTLDTQQVVTLDDVPMVMENFVRILYGPLNTGTIPKTYSLFSSAKWQDGKLQVQINENPTWYELVGVDNHAIADIITFAKQKYPDKWEDYLLHRSVGLLSAMGAADNNAGNVPRQLSAGPGSWVRLKSLDTKQLISIFKGVQQPQDPFADAKPTSSPTTQIVRTAERGMPFSLVVWRDDVPLICINDKWYELQALDGVSADKLVSFSKEWGGAGDWQRRFREDLSDIIFDMGLSNDAVDLQLLDVKTRQSVTLNKVPLLPENAELSRWGLQTLADYSRGTVSLFSSVRSDGSTIQVQINSNPTWFDLVSVNNQTAAQIINFAKTNYGDNWQTEITTNNVHLLAAMGGNTNDPLSAAMFEQWLTLRMPDTNQQVTFLKATYPGLAEASNRQLKLAQANLQQNIAAGGRVGRGNRGALPVPASRPSAPTSRSASSGPFPAPYCRVSIVDGQFVVDQLNLPDVPAAPVGRGARGAQNTFSDDDRVFLILNNPDGTLSQLRITRTLDSGTYRLLFGPSQAGRSTIAFQKQITIGNVPGPFQSVNLRQMLFDPNAAVGLPQGIVPGVTLTVTESQPNPAGGRVNTSTVFEDHAETFAQLRERHPNEIEQYVRPLLAKLNMDYLLGPADVDMDQVFSDVAIDPTLLAKMKPLIADLDSDSPETREAASKHLADLGAPAIVVMLHMDLTSLTPEQSARIVALCQGAKLLSDDEIAAHRHDVAFLCRCIVDGPKPVRAAALDVLKHAANRDISVNLDGTPDDRQHALEALGLPPATQP